MNDQDLLYTPPNPVGRPSKAFLAARAARQAKRMAAQVVQTTQNVLDQNGANITQVNQNGADITQVNQNGADIMQVNRPRHRNRNFTVAFKLFVDNYASTHSIRATAKHFGIER